MPIPMLPDEVAKRPLQFFWLLDASSSMEGRKIATLNQAVRESLPEILKAGSEHPEVQIQMRAIRFANAAEWHIGPKPVDIEQFVWQELKANGCTATAGAIELMLDELQTDKMPARGYPPVCILVSDGHHTDPDEKYAAAISRIANTPWARKAVRLAIAIGDETDYNEKALLDFVSHPEIGLLKAHTPQALVSYIRWASIAATVGASHGKTNSGAGSQHNVHLTPPPAVPSAPTNSDVF